MMDFPLSDLSMQRGGTSSVMSSAVQDRPAAEQVRDGHESDFSNILQKEGQARDQVRDVGQEEETTLREEEASGMPDEADANLQEERVDSKIIAQLLYMQENLQSQNLAAEQTQEGDGEPSSLVATMTGEEPFLEENSLAQETNASQTLPKGKLSQANGQSENAKDAKSKSETQQTVSLGLPLERESLDQAGQVAEGKVNEISGDKPPARKAPEDTSRQNIPTLKNDNFSHLVDDSRTQPNNLNIGDKVAIKNLSSDFTAPASNRISALDGVDIIATRKQGNLTILQLQLNPENLGTIEAKVRMDEGRLMVELSAANSKTAKLLKQDQRLLMQTLEEVGFGKQTQLSVSVVERTGQIMSSTSQFQQVETQTPNHHGGGGEQTSDNGSTEFSFSKQGEGEAASQGDSNHEQPETKTSVNLTRSQPLASGQAYRLVV